ncbi:MAG: Gfo/Idh/MocA family oxidoreductase [Myxococcales bacterium]|nr:Gfo/Idh/MocA family oxidoreductase [Myxococcales bacterium]
MARPRSPARREFLIQSAAAIAGLAVGCGDNRTPSAGLRLGVIGVGRQGTGHLDELLKRSDVHVVAVADVDATHLAAATALSRDLVAYRDYRELLARIDLDGVVIATPDHWHARTAIDAANAGKHVYCEKPLTLTLAEGRKMVDAARVNGIAFQTGSQLRSLRQFQLACEIVRNGRIGQLLSIETAVSPGPFQGGLPAALPQPATLDWDLWLGQCPEVPYHQLRADWTFRYFHDYAGGAITDLGAHELDIAQWGAGYERSGPTKIRGTATFAPGNFFETPTTFDVTFTYDNGVTLHLTTTDGDWSVEFTGTDGWIRLIGATLEASRPELLDYVLGSGAIVLATTTGHYENWFGAIANGTVPVADVEIGHRTASICHLANLAIELGRELTWDPIAEAFVGDAEADARRSRPQRAPWTV